MVVSYELDRLVKIFVFIASSVICSMVPINILWKAISSVKSWVTVSSGDGREGLNLPSTWVLPCIVEGLSR